MSTIRRLFIIPSNADPTSYYDDAGDSEIVVGIPPFLEGVVSEGELPYMYEETIPDPASPEPPPLTDDQKQIAAMQATLDQLVLDSLGA